MELREGEREEREEYSDRDEPVGYRTERLSITDRAQLIDEVRKLRKMIDIYHKEFHRRKRNHLKLLSQLQGNVYNLQQQVEELQAQKEGQ
jgi:hypothetical protein